MSCTDSKNGANSVDIYMAYPDGTRRHQGKTFATFLWALACGVSYTLFFDFMHISFDPYSPYPKNSAQNSEPAHSSIYTVSMHYLHPQKFIYKIRKVFSIVSFLVPPFEIP